MILLNSFLLYWKFIFPDSLLWEMAVVAFSDQLQWQRWRSSRLGCHSGFRRRMHTRRSCHFQIPNLSSRFLVTYSIIVTLATMFLVHRHLEQAAMMEDERAAVAQKFRHFDFHLKLPTKSSSNSTNSTSATSPPPPATPVAMELSNFVDAATGLFLTQSDRRLVASVQSLLRGPALKHYEAGVYSVGYGYYVDRLLSFKQYGFFIEAGAGSGLNTQTLFLETRRGWRGLLVEPNPDMFRQLTNTGRQVIHLNACLSPVSRVAEFNFLMNRESSRILNDTEIDEISTTNGTVKKVLCLPFFSIYQAIGSPTVDFMRLDVKGYDLDVLKTIPWETIDIHMISLKVPKNVNTSDETLNYLYHKGYSRIFKLPFLKPTGLSAGELVEDKSMSNVLIIKSGLSINASTILSP